MASVFKRGSVWKARYKDPETKRWRSCSTKVASSEPRWKAERIANELEKSLAAGIGHGMPTSVRSYCKAWIAQREAEGISSVKDDQARLEKHVLPAIGSLLMADVRPIHAIRIVRAMKAGRTLAPRTIRNVFWAAHGMFEEAVNEDLISSNPWRRAKTTLPEDQDKDSTWRDTAVFTRIELQQLLSDTRVPPDRRVYYAMLGLGGLRAGEGSGCRWRNYDAGEQPLGRLRVNVSYNTKRKVSKGTKTETSRNVPVHPWLRRILATWRTEHWPVYFGRVPAADDLIIPSRAGKPRSVNHMLKRFHQDLARLGLRRRRIHDLRRTFISLCLDCAAPSSLRLAGMSRD